jgi:hypothetical protein
MRLAATLFPDAVVHRDAYVSLCGQYRYWLTREWGDGPRLTWVMLNPSTADADTDDATIRKCVGFARRWGYGGFAVVNLFAWRATNPREVPEPSRAIGSENDATILRMSEGRDVVCAWGLVPRAVHRARVAEVLGMLRNRRVTCLGTTEDGQPRHPLMLAYATERVPYPPEGT